jgi:glycosyltransferase involved in cell wall biosynthesis
MSDPTPLVSIITPAYNRAPYLDETIQSVLEQDYPRVEYIILDDGSTDNTREVLQKYTGRLTWETHPNMGETRTVNKGWGMASGEILATVNSDDPLLPGAVSTAVAFLGWRPEILVAYPDWVYIGPNSEVIGHVQVPQYDYLYMLTRHHCIVGPGAFIRRRAFDLAGMRDPAFRYVADFEYWLRLGLYGPFARIPQTLATFRVHADSASVSHMGAAMAAEHIRLMHEFYSRPDLPVEVQKVRRAAFSSAHRVAAGSCGQARAEALRHYVSFALHHPPHVLDGGAWREALYTLLPRPAFSLLRSGWRTARRILAPAGRYRTQCL